MKTLMNLLLLTLALGAAGAQARAQSPAVRNPCIKLRIALDIGSGSTKIRSAVVDACAQTIVAQVSVKKAALGFKDHLSRPDSNGAFETQFIRESVQTITGMVRDVKASSAEALRTEPSLAGYADLAGSQPEVIGVATEAFRQAKNRSEFLKQMSDAGLTRVRVLPQTEEGHLGFLGVLAAGKLGIEAGDLISWDVGGASLQIVGYQGQNRWQDYGNRFASNPMRLFLTEGKQGSPNPIATDAASKQAVIEKALAYASTQMADLAQAGWLAEKLRANSAARVIGIGGVHGSVLSMLRKLPGHEQASGYTAADLAELLEQALACSDAELGARFGVDAKFASSAASNALLVYSVMKSLGIAEVRVADVDNTLGTMVAFTNLWRPVAGNATRASAAINP